MKKMKTVLLLLGFIIIALSVYNCGYKGPLYMPHNNEASEPAQAANNVTIKANESMLNESNVKIIKQSASSAKNNNNLNPRSNLNESN